MARARSMQPCLDARSNRIRFGFGFGFVVAAGRACSAGRRPARACVPLPEAALFDVVVVVFACAGRAARQTCRMSRLMVLPGRVMAVQGAVVRQVHSAGVWATFITGTLTE